jgi:hypothetical protein
MRLLQGTWNCVLKKYLRLIYFLVNTGMRVLHKLFKKSKVYTISSSEYFTYPLDWNIVFKLLRRHYTNLFFKSQMNAIPSCGYFIYALDETL